MPLSRRHLLRFGLVLGAGAPILAPSLEAPAPRRIDRPPSIASAGLAAVAVAAAPADWDGVFDGDSAWGADGAYRTAHGG